MLSLVAGDAAVRGAAGGASRQGATLAPPRLWDGGAAGRGEARGDQPARVAQLGGLPQLGHAGESREGNKQLRSATVTGPK